MNIQFVYFGKRGGGVNDLFSLLESINNCKFKIFSLNNKLIKNKANSLKKDIHFDYLTLPNSIYSLFYFIISFQWLRIFSILNKNKPQHIIITMFHPLNIFIYLYKFLFFKKVKIYYFLHNDNNIQTFNKLSDRFIRIFDIAYCFFSNKIFLLSESVYVYAKKHFILRYKKMNIIGFGVYYKHDAIVHTINFYKSTPLTFIYFGKILPYKGVDVLLSALELLNNDGYNYNCFIIGEGQIHNNNTTKNITIINKWVDDAELEHYINISHFSIFPYKFCSQSGALSTAISNNIPVLVSNISILSDYVNNNNIGFVLSDLNAETIAKKITEINDQREQLYNIHNNILRLNQNNTSWFEVWQRISENLLVS